MEVIVSVFVNTQTDVLHLAMDCCCIRNCYMRLYYICASSV